MSIVRDPNNIRLGIAGRVEDNDHPYSWSAILNGYERDLMRQWAVPAIAEYLDARPTEEFGIPGVRVTHIWADSQDDARRIAAASRIPNIANAPAELIGAVDAVLIPTDRGEEHLARARGFVEAGIPVFIDKPLCDNASDLTVFRSWAQQGRHIMSSSAMRYANEFIQLKSQREQLGELRLITMTMAKSWPRYGIHALEGVYPFLPPGGWISATNTGGDDAEVVHLRHSCGVSVIVAVMEDMFGGFAHLNLYGTRGRSAAQFADSFSAFKAQLGAFVQYLRTGERPFAFAETVELIKLLIAGDLSKQRGGRTVLLSEIAA
jgi:predicted dehydrogenase